MNYIRKINKNKLEKKNNNMLSTENPKTTICLYTSLFILYIGVLIFLIFGIIYLIKDYELAKECNNSNLWIYVLVSLILSCFNLKFKTNDEKSKGFASIINLVLLAIINLSLCIWGGLELFQYSHSCTDLYQSHLWIIGLISFILQLILCTICFISPFILLCFIYIHENNQETIIQNDIHVHTFEDLKWDITIKSRKLDTINSM